jgi:ABC-type polysaccharide/polyol phosphate transport system ATPase subunit
MPTQEFGASQRSSSLAAGASSEATPRELALSLQNVSLEFPVYSTETRSLKHALMRSVTGGNLRRQRLGASVVALSEINLEVFHGERVALIGHNGAGKSSFLRLVSGIYAPSSGAFKAYCAVYPMIQKAFLTSPELSGKMAIKGHYLLMNGNLRGFQEFYEDVVSFSGLGDYVRLPVKTYSDGMAARLLFSLLTGLRHDCLALDEGIGAGDSSFYEKAEQRLEEFVSSAGTLLLASHSDQLLQRFCTRGLVFDQGRIVFDGPLADALNHYHERHL